MAGWSAGIFTRARNWAQDKINLISPQAPNFDQEDDNFATGLNNCITKDGLNKPSATMDWNGQLLKNVGNALFTAQRITSNQTIPNSAVTDALFNSAITNVGAGYASGTGIFTAPFTGNYLVSAFVNLVNLSGVTVAFNGVYFSKNNVTAAGSSRYDFEAGITTSSGISIPNADFFSCTGVVILALTAADTIRVKCDVLSGGALQLSVGSYFSGYMLG